MTGPAQIIVLLLVIFVYSNGVVVPQETGLHGAVGCVTGVAQVVLEGFMNEGCVAYFKADIFQGASAGAQAHVVTGEAGFPQIFPHEVIPAPLVGVMTGGALTVWIELPMTERFFRLTEQILLVALVASLEEFLIAQQVANGGKVGGVTLDAGLVTGRMDHVVTSRFNFCVTAEAQLLGWGEEQHRFLGGMICMTVVTPSFQKGRVADDVRIIMADGMASGTGAGFIVKSVDGAC